MLFSSRNIEKKYGGIFAVKNVSLYIEKGETVGLIGSNGAGKTTLFNILTGFEKDYSGNIFRNNKEIFLKNPNDGVKNKLARTFQNIRIFDNLSVYDNILVAKNACKNKNFDIKKMLKMIKLDNDCFVLAKNLPYGKMRTVELLRAVATGSDLVFLDEPAAGMNDEEKNNLRNNIELLKNNLNLSYLIIEHDMNFIKSCCQRTLMMHNGEIIYHGKTADVLNNKEVIKAL